MAADTGYELLLAAGKSLTDTAILDAEGEPSDADLAQFLSVNREAFDRARHALRQECVVPLEYDLDFLRKQADPHILLRNLTRSFALELTAAERRGDLSGAVTIGLTILDLANATRRGGLILNMMVALAIEGIALDRLRRIRRRLIPDDATRLANELLRMEAEREPFDEITARDRQWEEAVGLPDEEPDFSHLNDLDVDEETKEAIREMSLSFADLPDNKRLAIFQQPDDRNLALLRLLAIESALLCFHARHGRYPSDLSRLTPDCIATLPLDPFTGTEFVYRLTPTGFVVYSPGPTGRDSGGTFGDWFRVLSGEADLGVDMQDYQCACCGVTSRPGLLSRCTGFLRRVFRR